MLRSDGYRYPPDLKDVPPEIWNLWLGAGRQVSAPWPVPGSTTCASRGATVTAARPPEQLLSHTCKSLQRPQMAMAWPLLPAAFWTFVASLQSGADARAQDPGQDPRGPGYGGYRSCARESICDGDASPGAVLGLLQILADDRTPPGELGQLLVEARIHYREHTWHSATVIGFQMKRAGTEPHVRAALQQEAVQLWIDEAHRTTGLLRMRHLETAIKLARDYGLPALADAATAMMQAIRSEDLGLKPHAFRFTLPDDAMEGDLSAFTNAPSWEVSLWLPITSGPPTGDAAVTGNRPTGGRRRPLYAAIPKTRMGGDGLPRFTASTEEQRPNGC